MYTIAPRPKPLPTAVPGRRVWCLKEQGPAPERPCSPRAQTSGLATGGARVTFATRGNSRVWAGLWRCERHQGGSRKLECSQGGTGPSLALCDQLQAASRPPPLMHPLYLPGRSAEAQKALEFHGDQRLVLNDQDATTPQGGIRNLPATAPYLTHYASENTKPPRRELVDASSLDQLLSCSVKSLGETAGLRHAPKLVEIAKRLVGGGMSRRRLNKLSCAGWLPHDRGFVSGLPRSKGRASASGRLITVAPPAEADPRRMKRVRSMPASAGRSVLSWCREPA